MREVLKIPDDREGQAWLYARRSDAAWPEHLHRELEYNLVLKGKARYLVEGKSYVLTPGTSIWLHPAQPHHLVEHGGDFAMWIVVFRPRMVLRLCSDPVNRPLMAARPEGDFCKQLLPEEREAQEMELAMLQDGRLTVDEFNARLGVLLLSAWRRHRETGSVIDARDLHPAVAKAVERVREGTFHEDLEGLARKCGLSPSRLSRVFKAQVGVSLARYRQQCALDRFVSLYGRGGRYSLTEAAERSGFGSYAQFYRVLSARFNCSPADYRRRVRAGQLDSTDERL